MQGIWQNCLKFHGENYDADTSLVVAVGNLCLHWIFFHEYKDYYCQSLLAVISVAYVLHHKYHTL